MDVTSTRYPGLLALLTATMGVGPLLTYGLSATSALVIQSLDLSLAQFGMLATITYLSASLLSAFTGPLTGRFSMRTLMAFVFAGAAVSFAVAAAAPNFNWLLAAMIISGAAQALSNPLSNKLIGAHAPLTKRARWVGIKQSGVQFSQFIASVTFPAAALIWGWRGVIWAATVAVGLLTIFAWVRTPSDSDLPHTVGDPADRPHNVDSTSKPSPPIVWLFTAYAFFSGTAMQATNVYLPLFAHDGLGFSLTVAGVAAALAGAVGVVSRILWGRALDRSINNFVLLLILGSGSMAGALILLASYHLPSVMWIGATLHGATALGASVVLMAGAIRLLPTDAVARASGRIAAGMYLGFGCGPIAMGALTDLTGGFGAGWTAVAISYALCVTIAINGISRIAKDAKVSA